MIIDNLNPDVINKRFITRKLLQSNTKGLAFWIQVLTLSWESLLEDWPL